MCQCLRDNTLGGWQNETPSGESYSTVTCSSIYDTSNRFIILLLYKRHFAMPSLPFGDLCLRQSPLLLQTSLLHILHIPEHALECDCSSGVLPRRQSGDVQLVL